MFGDPHHVAGENYFVDDHGEQRCQVIGMTRKFLLVLVVFVDYSSADSEILQIISARKAVEYEQDIYEDQFR